jgi:hypothetical protein
MTFLLNYPVPCLFIYLLIIFLHVQRLIGATKLQSLAHMSAATLTVGSRAPVLLG